MHHLMLAMHVRSLNVLLLYIQVLLAPPTATLKVCLIVTLAFSGRENSSNGKWLLVGKSGSYCSAAASNKSKLVWNAFDSSHNAPF